MLRNMNAIEELKPTTRTKQIVIRVTPDLYEQIRESAGKRKVKSAWLVRFILMDWLEEQSAKRKRRTA